MSVQTPAAKPARKSMTLRMILVIGGTVLVLGGVFGFKTFVGYKIKSFMASMPVPPQTVSAAPAAVTEWQKQIEAVGSLRAVNGADLSLEVSGIVDKILFKSGDDVASGTLLLQLRAQDDLAKLASLEASAGLAASTYARDQKQFKVQAISKQQLDTDEATLKNAQAQVDEQKAVVDKKFVRAPFAGHLGIRQVDVGQYLTAGAAIVTLQALDPIYVDFTLPQQDLDQIAAGQTVTATTDAYPGQKFEGKIDAVNPKVDANTRSLQVRATIPNPDHKLLPGMYATVAIATGAPQRLVTLPATAITYNPYGSTVFVVDDQGQDDKGQKKLVARQTFVTTGQTRGDQVAVESGVKEGETVVTAGQIKLRNGSPVTINNSVQPSNDPNPPAFEK